MATESTNLHNHIPMIQNPFPFTRKFQSLGIIFRYYILRIWLLCLY